MPFLVLVAACAPFDRGTLQGPPRADGSPTTTPAADTGLVPSPSQWGTCATLRSLTVVGGDAFDEFPAFARTADGGSFLRGRSEGAIRLGPGEAHETTFSPIGEDVWFVGRYAAAGTLEWAVSVDGSSQTWVNEPVAGADGGVTIGGSCDGTTVLAIGTPDETRFSTEGEGDLWLAHLDAAGHVVWVRRFGSPADDGFSQLLATEDGGFLAIGSVGGTVTFGAGEPNETTLAAAAPERFVARYEADGTLGWVRPLVGPVSMVPYLHATYDAAGDVLSAVGRLEGDGVAVFGDGSTAVTVDPAGDDAFVAQYLGDGTLAWISTVSGTYAVGTAAGAADGGGVFASGVFDGTVTFGRGQPTETALVAPNSIGGWFMARYDHDGSFRWATASDGWAFSPAVAPHGEDGLVSAQFTASVVLGAGTATESVMVSADDAVDGFVARYDAGGGLVCAVHIATTPSVADGFVSVDQILPRTDGAFDLVGVVQGRVSFGDDPAGQVDVPTSDLFVATIELVDR